MVYLFSSILVLTLNLLFCVTANASNFSSLSSLCQTQTTLYDSGRNNTTLLAKNETIELLASSSSNHYRIKNLQLCFTADHDIFYALQKDGLQKYMITVKSSDNLSSLFNSLGLGQATVLKLARVPKYGSQLISIKPGESLELWISPSGHLVQLDYYPNKLTKIHFYQEKNQFTAALEVINPTIKVKFAQGVINESLFVDCKKQGVSAKITSQLASIFGWDIDFVQDVRIGDQFYILYEEEYINNILLGEGDIIAATFVNKGKTITTIRYTDSKGNVDYYRTDGRSMKKAFLRVPVEFTRVSSKFNPSRLHPIFKTIHPHHGVDYAASMNTPIKASGDGVVIFSGWMNGYGNVVKLKHPQNIITVYAHANSIVPSIKKGKKVKQGEIIAKVGKTGWATGCHLHYEFQVAGKHRNPETVKLPEALPIKKHEFLKFQQITTKMLNLLEQHKTQFVDSSLSIDKLHNLKLILN